ncbi:TPA: class I SAM-dependent methyltransferase [Pseudomonas aeruginosa]|uniref:class I SAM-dependent methyltransferase n=1 Tax=Pseudomonas aeruginosa TaxID=287 RepID=UPI001CD816B2|nr:class I SAM-dependent methyltransferase [Pseudomonas aeruginosa]MDI3953821.1 class I SAM-dependent methyltransferase [Pseudomonas aeruginosa]MDV7960791.1 class I SAM-dependent methyltransferase [Pseudomonas aeruginosa]HBP1723777.1 class I SAM-dependent methyltransferase [Pseudomonas aeruginosa]HCE0304923.1 class I SAM-dependent methyltransferase [Pseudomonas aeruginosa]HCE3810271.1 class I SAM-dependent methyltransferase [Pseudomonas aeruginosa]
MTATEQIMALLERWDRQQEGYIRQREERYEAMFQLLEDLFGRDGRFTAIDAACGPGSLGRRLLERFPAARVVALDADVMLLEIARTALAGFAERVRVVECDAHFARRPLRRASEDEDCSLDFHLAALRQAGFAEVATVWQQLDNYVVFARLAQA